MKVCEVADLISLLALNTIILLNRLLIGIYSSIFCKNGPDSNLVACCTLPKVVVSHPFK